MKILALDIGFARVGFAIGDDEYHLAFPREIIAYDHYLEKIEWYITQSGENIEKIVVGMPNSLNPTHHTENKQITAESQHIQKIKTEIFRIKKHVSEISQAAEYLGSAIEIDTFDEQFTSKIAEQSLYTMGFSAKKQKGKKDAMAAAIILQGYLDRQKNTSL